MVFFGEENGSIPNQGPRGKPGIFPSRQEDGPSQAMAISRTKVQQPSSIALDPALEKALADSGYSAWALTILHDTKHPPSYHSSTNIDRHKSVLFHEDGWQRIQDAAVRASAARQATTQATAPSPVPEVAPTSDNVDHEPMAMTPSDADDESCPAAPLSASKRTLVLSSKPRRNRGRDAQPALNLTPRKRRHSSHSLSAESISEIAAPAAPQQRAFPVRGDFTFQISDSECVKWALRRLLDQLQQISLKALETEWIKVAEPKKQSNFPYSKKTTKGERKRNKTGPRIPQWWPIEESDYIEPHHNNKAGRTAVALALLRLRDRGSNWVDKLEFESRRVSLYFCSDKNDSKELEREQRRKRILCNIFLIAKYEEDFYFGCIDADSKVTAPDLSCVTTKSGKKKRRTNSSVQVSPRHSRATSTTTSPNSGSSPSELLSPANNLNLRDDSSYGIRSPHRLEEPPRHFLSGTPSTMPQSEHAVATLPRANAPHQPFRGHSYHGLLTTGLLDPEHSHIRARHSFDFNAKPSVSSYEGFGMDYHQTPRSQQYDVAQPPPPFAGWQNNSNLQPAYNVTASFPPRHNSLNGNYQVTESTFPGRGDFSFQAQDLMTSTAPYQDTIPVASPMSMAPPAMTRTYSQTGANGFQTANTQLPLSTSSPFQETQYREISRAGLQSFSINGHNQYQ
ncbi:hypothetical protein BU16DRAFT_158614 [Lophium mytilinum]|uniref:Subtelomeric hrmA-associated cluster protein AFUB-079030/YDR124W-like helical bundle domain-containing protein n=1 Tax=Lophium mytilinum TaxID=390894 RepID=A0A6A6QDS7_9PEZI|nr:hypothetical protein BU16DRAFT_158614 [Lophium mytilinum]